MTDREVRQTAQAIRDVLENEWGGVLSIHYEGRLGLKPLDAAERMAEPLLRQMDHHGLVLSPRLSLDIPRLQQALRWEFHDGADHPLDQKRSLLAAIAVEIGYRTGDSAMADEVMAEYNRLGEQVARDD